jgi:adenosylcobyric acid synthase
VSAPPLRGALMVCGTTSDAGKSRVVTGLCRVLHRQGVSVAPFKAQNMALNSYVTPSGHEIGRAQGVQALAAGTEPHVDMNPILLKPTGERTSQVVVLGEPTGHLDARSYHALKPELRATVLASFERLRDRFDVVVMEGAGSPAEINLLEHDLVNLWMADAAGAAAVVVGDIDRGGVFASLYGTVALLPEHLRRLVRGFIINKFRGDPALLTPGLAQLESRTGVPTLGVLPFIAGLDLDAEDSLALTPATCTGVGGTGASIDVAVVRLPRISNFTDFDALGLEPGVSVRYVEHPAALGRPDLAVLPGSKATVSDLAWLRGRGFVEALRGCGCVLGICGGYQMLGRTIEDTVESGQGMVEGLGWLDAETRFLPAKITRQRRGTALGHHVAGYQIHHGLTVTLGDTTSWVHLDDAWGEDHDGAASPDARVMGTTLHGLFESDGFRAAFLADVARRRGTVFTPAGVSFRAAREAQFDRLADLLEAHLDLAAVERLIAAGSRELTP